jgi:uncharacterized membrane protein
MSDQSGKNTHEAPTPSEQTSAEKSPIQSEIIPPALNSALRTAGIDTRDPNVFRALEISLTTMFSGALPLPPPQILNEYRNVHPDLVAKIIEWTEQQSSHRKSLELITTKRTQDRYDRGQWIAGSVAVGGLALAAITGIFGNPWVAAVIAVVAVGGPTAAIYLARTMGRAQAQQPAPKEPTRPTTG